MPTEERIDLERKLFKKPTQFTNTTSGRDQTRTIESLFKEAQQNCLGKITNILYKGAAGALQTVIMVPNPSTIRPSKFGGGVFWEDIVAEVERKFMPPLAEIQQTKKPHIDDL